MIRALGGNPKDLDTPVRLSDEPPDTARRPLPAASNCWSSTNDQFFNKAGCFACHEQPPAEFAAAAARAKGIPVDEKASATNAFCQITSTINAVALEGAAALGGADNNLYAVEALVRAGYPANRITDFLAANLAASQGGDGGWHLPGYSRSPLQDSDFSRTAMAMRTLKTYGTPGRVGRNEAAHRTRQTVAAACRTRDSGGYGHAPRGSGRGGRERRGTSQTSRTDSGAAAPGRRLGATPGISKRRVCHRHDVVGSE